jgi:hypothetical protein
MLLKFPPFMYKVVKISVASICCKQLTVIEFLIADKESMGTFTNVSAMFMKVDRSTTGRRAKRVMASKTGTAVSLRCCNVLMPSFTRINTSQPEP